MANSFRCRILVVFVVVCLSCGEGCSLEKIIEDVVRNVLSQQNYQATNNVEAGFDKLETSPITDSNQQTNSMPGLRSCLPRDCADLAKSDQSRSGVYKVWPEGWNSCGAHVYCDMEKDGGGWTVIQRRGNYGNPKDYFYRRWRDYKFGFGNLTQDFWLGNDKLHSLSSQDNYVLLVNMKTKENETRYAQYDEFYIENEGNKYKLWIHGFKGDAGDSLNVHNGAFFGTQDRDNDNHEKNCAVEFKGAWWYNKCHEANLNGLYYDGQHDSYADGINWKSFKDYHYSLREVEMKIRPKFYRMPEKHKLYRSEEIL